MYQSIPERSETLIRKSGNCNIDLCLVALEECFCCWESMVGIEQMENWDIRNRTNGELGSFFIASQ